jgi:hypothetical protein
MSHMSDKEYSERTSEDFQFLVLCQAKHNMGMYELLRDRELEAERKRRQALSDPPAAPAPFRNQDKEERTA